MSVHDTGRVPRLTLQKLQERARAGEKLVMLTCYDATFAAVSDEAGVDMLLIGDSLGNVIQGAPHTLAVTIDDTAYHTRAVANGSRRALVIADMPFGSFQESKEQAFRNAAKLLGAGAGMVKMEGGHHMVETVRFLVERGIPVCSHIGLTPQSFHTLGGHKVQGRTEEGADRLVSEAEALVAAGAGMILMEAVPNAVGKRVVDALPGTVTIGIGAGPDVSGQVLVNYDILDIYPGKKARFVKNFMAGQPSVQAAIAAFVAAVRDGSYPAPEHCF
jgi:3-methyl-2-oxobutanoate hydroxymethyltransferase